MQSHPALIERTMTVFELLQNLIRIESTNPSLSETGRGEREAAHFLGNVMKRMGLEVHYQEWDETRANVIGVLKSEGTGPSLMLNGHLDTVGIEKMKIDPLFPLENDGKMYGRGTADMKAGIAAQVEALRSVIESGRKPKGDVILAYVADEEYRSAGTERLLKEYRADACIISEPTRMTVAVAHRGFAWIRINVHGRVAHGSMPEQGVDAIAKAGPFLTAIERLNELYRQKESHPLLGSASIHASTIHGGIGISTYPDLCMIELEKRTLPGESDRTVAEEIEQVLAEIRMNDPGFRADCTVYFTRPALETPENTPVVKALSQAVSESGCPLVMGGVPFWTDAALFAEAGIPTAIFGPSGDGLHSAVEWVELESIEATAKVLSRLITGGGAVSG